MLSSSSSSSSSTWVYDVFPSFGGKDVRKTFLSHFYKEFDRKKIRVFRDKKIKTGESLDPVLEKAIKDSRIAIVILSQNYASSGWCLNELLEILKREKELDQIVIPVFYDLDPWHVRYQIGYFGEVFTDTCKRKTEDEIQKWREALFYVANLVGYHSREWDTEARMIEEMSNDVLDKLDYTPSEDSEDLVGIKDHIANIRSLLTLESKEVRTVGIWGPSGIGKTTIARALYNRLSHHFQCRIFIDRGFISKSLENYSKCNPDDPNMKLHLQENFLSKILEKEGIIKVDHLGAVRDRLRHEKVLMFIDDLEDKVVLDALVGGDDWFGPGSRIIAITIDRQILRGHGIEYFYEVPAPSKKLALEMLCRSAFKTNSPPDGFMELASEVVVRVGSLPLGLTVLGSSLRGRNKKYWIDLLPTLRKGLDGSIEKALRISYDGLERKEHKALFRHIACFFNGDEINYIKLMLADSELNVETGLEILVDKSLIHVTPSWDNTNIVEMHCLVQEMGKENVRAQSDKPGEREFLMDSKDVCNVLRDRTGTENVLGISLDLGEVDKVRIHENSFEAMTNLHFLKFYKKSLERKKEVRWQLPKKFSNFPDELKLLIWPGYPMECMPSNFCPESLVELKMPNSKLKKLWDGVESLTRLKDMDLSESKDLEEIPDLSEATNLETLNISGCTNLVELFSSIENLNKLTDLNMDGCTNLEALPNGTNLRSLIRLSIAGCSKLKVFPDISSNIQSIIANKTAFQTFPSQMRLENLIELRMEHIMSEKLWEGVQPLTSLKKMVVSGSKNIKEIPNLSMATSLETLKLNKCSSLVELTLSSLQNLNKLTSLEMIECSSLEDLPTGINLKSLYLVNLNGCLRLRSFPDISRNISTLYLNKTSIEDVPSWISNFTSLEALEMWECKELKCISHSLFKLKRLDEAFFSDSEQLTEVSWPLEEGEATNNTRKRLSLISFINCLNLAQETFIQQSASKYLILPGVRVPDYFTPRSRDSTFTIPLHYFSLCPQPFLDFKACVLVSEVSETEKNQLCFVDVEVHCRSRDNEGNYSEHVESMDFSLPHKYDHMIIFDCRFRQNQDSGELNCEQVEIEFNVVSTGLKLIECGIKVNDFTPSLPNPPGTLEFSF